VRDVVSPHQGPQQLVGQPMTLSRTPSNIARTAPRRGEHSDEILSELGYSADALADMKQREVY
jgi:formyl-CoA transferase